MSTLDYNLSRPRDYIDVMCRAASCMDIHDTAVSVMQKFLGTPSRWNGQRHIEICACSIMIASEIDEIDDARQSALVNDLSVLSNAPVTHLLEMAVNISGCTFI